MRALLDQAQTAGLCEVVLRQNATLDEILDVFQDARYRNAIAVFHYGGHANGYQLLLETAAGKPDVAHAGGLATFLGQQTGLELVFLNGCSTQQQAQGLLDAGVSAVIATAQAIDDEVATGFAVRFYTGLANGSTLNTAFAEAEAAVKTARGNEPRHLYYAAAQTEAADRWPWALYLRPGAELAAQWNLPEAADDALFGLPALPALDLPDGPYRNLSWYRREDAELFFGRAHAVRDLYTRVTAADAPPLILFYGQSGVGKSSLLAAGLLPRLEQSHTVLYLRRDQTLGLLGTLSAAPSPLAAAAPGLDWLPVEQQTGRPLLVVLDQVEELYTRPNAALPDEMERFLAVLHDTFGDPAQRPQGKLVLGFRKEWLAEIEKQVAEVKLPRTKVFLERLDRRGIIEVVTGPAQVERLQQQYGLTVEDGLAELIADDLLEDRASAIAPTLQTLLTRMWSQAKQRDDTRPRFDQNLYLDLKREGILLGDFLDRQLAALARWRNEVVRSGLALDLLTYHTTPVGTAEERSAEEYTSVYHHLAQILPSLVQQCKDLYLLVDPARNQPAQTAASRLAHDALAPLVRSRYEESDAPGQRARRILESRVVDWQSEENPGPDITPLDRQDLKVVEAGKTGMRAWTETELRLIEASRVEQARRERLQRVLWVTAMVAVALITVSSIFGWWQWGRAKDQSARAVRAQGTALAEATRAYVNEVDAVSKANLAATREVEAHTAQADAEANARQARSRELAARAQELLSQEVFDPSLALLLSVAAIRTTLPYSNVDPYAERNLQRVLLTAQQMGWRMTLPQQYHTGEVHSAVFSPDGATVLTASEDQSARVWDVTTGKQLLLLAGHDGGVWDAEYSPNGALIATTGQDGTVRLWDAKTGKPQRTWQAHDDRVRTLAFSPDGTRLVTASQDGTARVWRVADGVKQLEFTHDGGWILSAKFSPDGAKVVTTGLDKTNQVKSARLWDAVTGKLLATLPYSVWVRNTAFTHDGKRLVTVNADGTVRVWDAATGTGLTPFPPQTFPPHSGKGKELNSIAFSKNDALAAVADSHGQILAA